MKTGNKSKYAGDLNEQYSLIKQICDEIEEQEESKDSKNSVPFANIQSCDLPELRVGFIQNIQCSYYFLY